MATTRAALAVEKNVSEAAVADVSKTPEVIQTETPLPDEHQEISRIAHDLWEQRQGTGEGSAEDDWLRAEEEYRSRRNGS